MGSKDIDYYIDLSNQVKAAKTRLSECKGERRQLMSGLKELGLKTVSDARKEIESIDEEMEALEKTISRDVKSLKDVLED